MEKDLFLCEGEEPNVLLKKYLKAEEEHDETPLIVEGAAAVGSACFEQSKVRAVVFGEGLRELGPYAFYFATRLKSISLPASVERVGKECFHGCFALKDIDFFDWARLGRIEEGTFQCCGLTILKIPRGVKHIGKKAFAQNFGLRVVYLPDTVETIEEGAFEACDDLEGVYLEGGVKSGFAARREEVVLKKMRPVAGWDYHTHVGDPELEEYEERHMLFRGWLGSETPEKKLPPVYEHTSMEAFAPVEEAARRHLRGIFP